VCGAVAGAVVAGRLMGLDADRICNAMGIAGSMASGSLEFLHTGSSTKQLHPGWAAHGAVVAARLAAAGADGPASILEGRYGVVRAFTGAEVDADAICDGLGSRWETARIGLKPYPACQLFHRSIDALASIRSAVAPTEVASMLFDIPREAVAIVCEPEADKRAPRSDYEAKFSLPYSAAAYLVDGRLTVGSYDPAALGRPEVLDIARRVAWTVTDPGLPPGDAPGRVVVTLTDGRTLTGTSPAGPQPSTDPAVLSKLEGHDLPATTALAAAVLALEQARGVSDVLAYTSPILEEVR
jgi:2-methylcitrate dehydratase PrpD